MVAQVDSHFLRARPAKLWPRLLAYAVFEGRPLTTRARWVNPLVFLGYKLWGALPVVTPITAPIFILGVGRSGTTILGKILALHPHVGYLNEPKALWHAALGDDDLNGSYSTKQGRYRMSRADLTERPRRLLPRFYGAYLRMAGCRRIVDKYPELLFRTGLIDTAFPDARKIVIIRNGYDTCQSIENWSARHGRSDASCAIDWWGRDQRKWHSLVEQIVAPDPYFGAALPAIRALTRHTDMAAVEWIVTMREALRLHHRQPTAMLLVHYEDLTTRPQASLQKILSHCALPLDEKVLNYAGRVLRPRPPYARPTLAPALTPLFEETMERLGYQNGAADAHSSDQP